MIKVTWKPCPKKTVFQFQEIAIGVVFSYPHGSTEYVYIKTEGGVSGMNAACLQDGLLRKFDLNTIVEPLQAQLIVSRVVPEVVQ